MTNTYDIIGNLIRETPNILTGTSTGETKGETKGETPNETPDILTGT